jgi:RND family efflux transporter MFP subunit
MKRAWLVGGVLALASGAAHAETVITGTTVPVAKVDVPSVLNGQLAEIFVKEGSAIKKGQPICKLDDQLQQLTVQLKQLDADSTVEIRDAQAQIDYAQNEYTRARQLGGAGSPAELRQKELQLLEAKLALEAKTQAAAQKKIDCEREKVTLEKMTIASPLDGSVLRIDKQVGESINQSDTVATVVQTTRLQVPFFLDKSYFGKVHVGDKLVLDLATDPPTKRDAVAIAVDPVIDPSAPIFRVKVEFANEDQSIPAGVTAKWQWR